MSKVTLSHNGNVIGIAESVEVRDIPTQTVFVNPAPNFYEMHLSGGKVSKEAILLLLGCPRPKRHMKSRKWSRRRNKQYARWVLNYGWLYGIEI